MNIVRRTFEAAQHPAGSPERQRLNLDWLTSEYMTSHRYGIRESDGSHTPFTYRTKAEAEAAALRYAHTQPAKHRRALTCTRASA